MAFIEIGRIIRERRIQAGLSQEDICEKGIDSAVISRLERGERLPRKDRLDRIMERLGLNIRLIYSHCVSKSEAKDYEKQSMLRDCLYEGRKEEAAALIEKLSKEKAYQSGLRKQLILYARAVLMSGELHGTEELRTIIEEAMRLSLPSFSETRISEYLLTNIEAALINLLAVSYFEDGDSERAIKVLVGLKTSLERTRLEDAEKELLFPTVLYNLSKYLGLSGRNDEAVEYCDYGIKLCTTYNRFRALAKILYNKACGYHQIGKTEECKKLFYQAYCLLDLAGVYEERNLIKKYAAEKYGVEIEL